MGVVRILVAKVSNQVALSSGTQSDSLFNNFIQLGLLLLISFAYWLQMNWCSTFVSHFWYNPEHPDWLQYTCNCFIEFTRFVYCFGPAIICLNKYNISWSTNCCLDMSVPDQISPRFYLRRFLVEVGLKISRQMHQNIAI